MEFSELEVFTFLISSALVFIMVPGLALFYGGLVRHKNVIGTMMHSVTAIGVVSVLWVLWGYSLAFGNSVGGLGFVGDLTKFGMIGVNPDEQAFMVFQGMFAIITVALIAGGFAERFKFSSYVIFAALWVTIVYAPLCHWVWGGGWLGNLGSVLGMSEAGFALDFAGGTVVHIASGTAALAAAFVVGRRSGFGTSAMIPHNVPLVLLGAGLLWFGWFGFNAGSSFNLSSWDAANAFVVTNVAAATAMSAWSVVSWFVTKRPSASGAAAGAVAGLVAITPAAGFVGVMPAIIIGAGAGAACFFAVELIHKLRIDDSLDVFGIHGIGGMWGALATGLFVGIGFGALDADVSRIEQVLYQLIGIGAAFGWSFVVSGIILLALKYTIGLRVSDTEEEIGVDLTQHGEGTSQ
ncbi:MAG: ammonium transporter [Chloroflexi bacterium]|nr:ammonium transporter [Chloroflexota bacterium]MYD49139.1 ammonium transporter [Chloroflexota bacterium]